MTTGNKEVKGILEHGLSTWTGGLDLSAIGAQLFAPLKEEELAILDTDPAPNKKQQKKKQEQQRKAKKAKEEEDKARADEADRVAVPLLDREDLTVSERAELISTHQMNRCNKCNQNKPLESFYKRKQPGPDGINYWLFCIKCENKQFNTRSDFRVYSDVTRYCRTRAKRQGMEFDLEPDDIRLIFEAQGGRCAYTGKAIYLRGMRHHNTRRGRSRGLVSYHNMNKASVDRIDSTKGYTRDNVHLVCLHINYAKLDLSEADFVDLCAAVVQHTKKRGLPSIAPLDEMKQERGCSS